jgi:hypothetical protein
MKFKPSESCFVVSRNIKSCELNIKTHEAKPNHENIVYAKGDSAASSHYWHKEDKHVLSAVKTIQGPAVMLPNK